MPGWGTFYNVMLIILGVLLGLRFKKFLPDRFSEILLQVVGLFIIFVGFSLLREGQEEILLLLSLIGGVLIGETLDITGRLNHLGARFSRKGTSPLSRGFVTASLLFCVGPMAIIGSLADGLTGDSHILLTKAVIDGIASVPLAATLGIGVVFSIFPLMVYQGGITLLAFFLEGFFSPGAIAEISALGGIIMLAMGIELMGIKKIRVANLLPAIPLLMIAIYFLGI